MTPSMLDNLVKRGMITDGSARVPLANETSAHPEVDKVVVFKDFFTDSLHFPLDHVVVEVF